jgi:SAM-dependent methyltransferase
MRQDFSYATPLQVDRVEECSFYHKMHIPGVGEVGDGWDLRSSIDNYLGGYDFKGKRVLDVGAASGHLTFEMEKRGAEVVSFDMLDGSHWDVVPQLEVQNNPERVREENIVAARKIRNAYWFAHRRLGSKARAYYGDIYDLPGELGVFDVAFFGMILSHLRDPFQALYSASRLVSDTIIITNQMSDATEPVGRLIPSRTNGVRKAWWGFTHGCLSQMLEILGFEVKNTTTSTPTLLLEDRLGAKHCTSLVAKRGAGSPCLTGSARGRRSAA